MKKERKTAMVARSGVGLSAALWLLIAVAAVQASPTAAPVNIDPPTITGTAQVGEVLTAHNGTWDNAPTSYRYRWLRCNPGGNSCALLAADGETYRLGQADVGRTMRVRVTAVNADGATNARSEQTEVVGSNAAPLDNTARPTITGEARVGQELSASEGTWTGNPTSFAFQWQRCNIDAITCLDVTGATGRTYGVRLADLGFRLRVQVVARKDGRSGTATSAPTAVVQPTTPVTNARPTLRILKVTFLGAKVYVRFRVCDDQPRNLGILVRRRGLACAQRSGASQPAFRPARAVRTREAGYRLSGSVALAVTRSRFGHVMPQVGRACLRSARSVDSWELAGTERRRGASHFNLHPGSRLPQWGHARSSCEGL